ncbi:MAG: carboxypeptidase-like regulatory domain-containing protein, partial [Acidobacteriota bacterium]|nr:carboxypeptidase-like regulatory domain-containing protein [Acidobacteriota bacterium]
MKLSFITALLVSLLFVSTSTAQTHRASIRGAVSDATEKPVSGVTINLTRQGTNATRAVQSDSDGRFVIAQLPPGSYRLQVESAGYKRHVQSVELLVNQEQRIDVQLAVGELSEEVVIVDDARGAGLLKKDSASLGTVIENGKVEGLPLDGRNFFELSLLVPGAVPAAQGSAGSVRGDFAFSVNGAREDSNNFLLDGVYNVDPKLNTFGVRPPVDAIREFETLTSTYDAAFGRSAGAQINVVLKSGTNDLHGSLYEFHRNGALDARNYFAPADEPAPKYIRNQFGFTVGGPIIRNRTFFFADYEGTRSREGITRVTNVPTLSERAGDFSQSLFGVPRDPFTQQPFPN